ncbi:MAG TPA: hypothetical protein EYP21_08605 [Syntrophaceae bacterium]|nr:hypothetical protein [Syntrophaceae bacterium]
MIKGGSKTRIFIIFIFSGIILSTICQYSYAQPNPAFYGDAGSEVSGTYTITIKKIEISQDGSTFITVGEGDLTFNIAGGSAGATIGNYVTNSSIPPGTYTTIRITLSRTITIKGRSGNQGGNYYYTTTSAGQVSGFYKAGSVAVGSWPPGDYAAVSFQVPSDAEGEAGETLEIIGDDMRTTKDFVNPIVVKAGETQTISISFNTQRMIGFEAAGPNYIFYPMPPEESAE